jgi:fructose-bisphosphate aldolase class II
MPLHNFAALLKQARRERFAVPLFDAFDSDSVDGIIAAAGDLNAPVIVAMYDSAMEKSNAAALAAYIRTEAERCSTPVALMLDHGKDEDQVRRAIAYGFTGVMFDGSRLPIQENTAITRSVVSRAHAAGLYVEAELGVVGSGSNYENDREAGLTDPDAAVSFVEETGVDILAVAIGTAHGVYHGEPKLDLERLAQIASRIDLPLALHGGSGLSDDQFRAAIAGGMAKANVATDLYMTAGARMAETGREKPSYWAIHSAAVDAIRKRCSHYISLFGAAGKAVS